MNKDIRRKFSNKRVNAAREGIGFCLSIEEFTQLIEDARITAEDIGNKGYHLARYNDTGEYKIDNCRFIHYTANLAERKISDTNRKVSSENITKHLQSLSKDDLIDRAKRGIVTRKANGTQHLTVLTDIEIQRRILVINSYDQSQRGWISQCSSELEISHTQLRRFINKHVIGV